jgi:hypothetical protein
MSTESFEPYGESLSEFGSCQREPPKAASAILSAVGQYGFWLLVVVVVFARIASFSPAPWFSTDATSASIGSAQR